MNITVDAELHSGKNNIVQNILSSLFLCFNNKIDLFNNHQKREILEIFEIVFNDINYIQYYGGVNDFSNDISSKHSLEILSGTASACNIKKHLTELKNLLEIKFGEINLNIENYNSTRIEDRNEYHPGISAKIIIK